MKKLTKEECAELLVGKCVRSSTNPIVIELRKLEVGGSIFVEKKEWDKKTKLGVYITGIMRDGKKFSTITVENGWVIIRKI